MESLHITSNFENQNNIYLRSIINEIQFFISFSCCCWCCCFNSSNQLIFIVLLLLLPSFKNEEEDEKKTTLINEIIHPNHNSVYLALAHTSREKK